MTAAASSAVAPRQLGARHWRRVLRRSGAHVMSHHLPLLSAGIAFFAVLSIAPVLVTAVSVYSAVNSPEQAVEQLREFAEMLPPQLEPLVGDQLTVITNASSQVLTRRGLTGLVLALWTATTAATYLVDALTLAYHEVESRSFLRRTVLGLLLVLGGALLVGAVIVAGRHVSGAVDGSPGPVRAVAPVLAWAALGLVMTAALAVLYRFAPDRKQARWCWTSWGATTATVLWLLTSAGLFAYVQRATYESTYGSLSGVAISMLWVWISVFLLIVGATINAEAERQTVRDSTVGPEQPLGARGAVVADSAPPYPGEG